MPAMCSRARGAGLVHGAGAGHEQRDAARPQPGDRAGDEVVVQAQAEGGRRRIGAHDAVRERRVADRQVEPAAERAAGVVLASDARPGMHVAGDAGGDRIVFDAGQPAGGAQASGSSAKNRPVPMPGSSTRPPAKPRCWAARQSARMTGSGV